MLLHIEFNASLFVCKEIYKFILHNSLPHVPYLKFFIELFLSQRCFMVLAFPSSDNHYKNQLSPSVTPHMQGPHVRAMTREFGCEPVCLQNICVS